MADISTASSAEGSSIRPEGDNDADSPLASAEGKAPATPCC
ncbi:hypothetical protein APHMUC_0511 [Anaplasma phagocytophilum str. ApMUC09]|uniref:Uncharacterized protein n=1 Tax=Anaplasma phagocytophilum str. ApMUC09 TaxID=1359152 RepID=A0A0F3NAF8_ANAPH|nr:hypothetical protein APHMUC_0511 [Anaplasma phagocytophilum str. ApMUC09]